MKIDEKLSLSSTLFSCLDRITTGRNPNWPLGLRRVSPARACEGARRSLARRVSVGPQSRACGTRCPVWSTERASTARTRNPAEAKRPGAEQKNRGFDLAWHSDNGRTNPAHITWQEIHNLFYILRFDQKHRTNWHLTTWPDCAKRTRARSTRQAITREGASAVGMGSRASVDRESLKVRARCHSGRGWQRKPRGVRRSRYAMICEAGAWERGKPRVRSCQQHREWTNEATATRWQEIQIL